MAKKSKISNLYLIFILCFLSMFFMYIMMTNEKETFSNIKENFEQIRKSNSCDTCKVRNQG